VPMTEKEHPELVTDGPYRFVRHPIYTGLLVAMLGTALATNLYVLIAPALAVPISSTARASRKAASRTRSRRRIRPTARARRC
jgi:protein-S-isoprenylcysteine O-methyltransferase Ste14